MQIESHPEQQNKFLVTFENRREEIYFRLNSPFFSTAHWGHFGQLGPTRHARAVNPNRGYPSQITAPERTVKRVAERLEEEVLPMIHDKEGRQVATGVLEAIKVHIEPVAEAT